MLLSEEEGVEKPSPEIFRRAYERLGVAPNETVHVGDELDRPGPEGEEEHKETGEDLTGVEVVPSLSHVVEWVRGRNSLSGVA
ncbi:hypothetical protein TRAPUB_14281 [Trametes pubescens]|uniref:Uncharacterized protein n=1 Tax=Trametes pubescens TaxID=154538 RepID=A0A1M2VNV5_TRAPU|nr:hypothetical protein TRAPUB_14281 [Trametes pubescens]